MKVDREKLLTEIKAVKPGVGRSADIEQSTFIAFQNGVVQSYDGEVSCHVKSCVKLDEEFCVEARPLEDWLSRCGDLEITFSLDDDWLVLKAKDHKYKLPVDKKVGLPFHEIDSPDDEWMPFGDEMREGVHMGVGCAGSDESLPYTCMIHIHPEFIESVNKSQLVRFRIETGVKEKVLIRKEAAGSVVSMPVKEFSVGSKWVHFRTDTGVVLSCRRRRERYPVVNDIFKPTGDKVQLPKETLKEIELANVASSSEKINMVSVYIDNKFLKIRGIGTGVADGRVEVTYEGEPMKFTISPKLFTQALRKSMECEIGKNRLIVDRRNYTFVVCTRKPNVSSGS
jgi:DNA polymerase III sliding clamp (beta) subunit (PCNA family)